MSDFVSLFTAFSGLQAAQAGMDTTSHNIANAGTDGYTRQRVDLATRYPHTTPFGKIGTGVSIDDISRARNEVLDLRYRSSIAGQAQYRTLGELLMSAESALGEPDGGVTAALGSMWSAFEDWSLDPPDGAARQGVLARLGELTDRVRTLARAWESAEASARTRQEDVVTEANALIRQVADLNRSILSSRGAPGGSNDLADERDRLVDRLAELTGATATVTDSGSVRVSLNGLALVHDTAASLLSVDGAGTVVHSTGTVVEPGGVLAGYRSFLEVELPPLRQSLDTFASELADALNAQHVTGFTRSGAAGGPLLNYAPGSAASTLEVAITDPADLAAAGSAGPPVAAFDGVNAEALSGLRSALAALGGTDTIDGAARAMIGSVGATTASARATAASHADLAASADSARLSGHGVSIDEEMVNLLTYQRAYEAAARVMTAVDQTLDTLINRTGVVGR